MMGFGELGLHLFFLVIISPPSCPCNSFHCLGRFKNVYDDDDDDEGSGISWTICKQSTPRSRQITTPTPRHSVCTGRMLFLTPNQQCQNTEGSINSAQINNIIRTSDQDVA